MQQIVLAIILTALIIWLFVIAHHHDDYFDY